MASSLPRQHSNSQNALWSIAADNQLRTTLETGLEAVLPAGLLAGGTVTATGAFAVELAAGTVVFCEGVAVTLASAGSYSGLTPSTTNHLWGLVMRTARNRNLATAVDTWSLALSHNTTGTPPSSLHIPLAVIVCDGAGVAGITYPAGRLLQLVRSEHLAKSVAGGAGDTTLTQAEFDATSLEFTGALTGNRGLILPLHRGRAWVIYNGTTGPFTLTVKGPTGAGVAVTQGKRAIVTTDGTNFFAALSDLTGLGSAGFAADRVVVDEVIAVPLNRQMLVFDGALRVDGTLQVLGKVRVEA